MRSVAARPRERASRGSGHPHRRAVRLAPERLRAGKAQLRAASCLLGSRPGQRRSGGRARKRIFAASHPRSGRAMGSDHGQLVRDQLSNEDTALCKPHAPEVDGCRQLKCPGDPPHLAKCDDFGPGACAPRGDLEESYAYYEYVDATTDLLDRPARHGHEWAVIEYGSSTTTIRWTSASSASGTRPTGAGLGAGRAARRKGVAGRGGLQRALLRRGRARRQGAVAGHASGQLRGLDSHANYPTKNDLPVRFACLEGQPPGTLERRELSNPKFNGSALELPIVNLIGLHDQTGNVPEVTDTKLISAQTTGSIGISTAIGVLTTTCTSCSAATTGSRTDVTAGPGTLYEAV